MMKNEEIELIRVLTESAIYARNDGAGKIADAYDEAAQLIEQQARRMAELEETPVQVHLELAKRDCIQEIKLARQHGLFSYLDLEQQLTTAKAELEKVKETCRVITRLHDDEEKENQELHDQLDKAKAEIEGLRKDKEWAIRSLKQIKHWCLTSKDSLPMILSRIVRICIDAGITQSYVEIETEWRTGQETTTQAHGQGGRE